MRRGALLIAVLVFAVAAGAAAGHGTKKFDSTVKITAVNTTPKRGTHYFHGVVNSPKKGCYQQREVTLYHVESGVPAAQQSTMTNAKGKWTFTVGAFYPGKWYARVELADFGSYLCKADRSNTYVHEI